MAQSPNPSSAAVIVVKRMKPTMPKSVSVVLSEEFYIWHLCHCFDFVAVFWIRELRAGRELKADRFVFTNAMVPYAIKVCLSCWIRELRAGRFAFTNTMVPLPSRYA